jgi:phage shock protein C
MTCAACGREMNGDAKFCSGCGQATPVTGSIPAPQMRGQLVRPQFGRMVAGVCAGFAEHYGWDVAIVRLVLALAVLFGAGTPLVAYVIAWIVIPNGPFFLPQQATPPAVSQPEAHTNGPTTA